MFRISQTVKVIIVANILFYIGSLSLGEGSYYIFAMHYPLNDSFYFWQVLTSMFMHDITGIGHILFNMLMLLFFGSDLERFLGQKKFLFLYFSAGLGATGLALLINYLGFLPGYNAMLELGFTQDQILEQLRSGYIDTGLYKYIPKETIESMYGSYYTVSAGASGAIFGVLAAFAVQFPNEPLFLIIFPVPIKAKYLIGAYFALNVISAFSGYAFIGAENTGFWAHVGGGVIGFIVMWYWKKNSFDNKRLY